MKWIFYDKEGNVYSIFSEKPSDRLLKNKHICVEEFPLEPKEGYKTVYTVKDGSLVGRYEKDFKSPEDERLYVLDKLEETEERLNSYQDALIRLLSSNRINLSSKERNRIADLLR